MVMIAQTPSPPYYAVIFSNVISDIDIGYEEMATKMMKLASEQDGFLGVETAREELGITVSYWRDLESIKKWKENSEHAIAQDMGKEIWYRSFKTRIARIERDYEFSK
ncbi:MAG: antibiotic biosynthesis monooxygenase [Bacteroidetes bacterium]|nr:antibiotic biosynthesis monooxygenase [Bacteroidota bacterium]